MKYPKEITVVYSVNDQEAFKSEWKRLHDLLLLEKDAPFLIHAISNDDEICRVRLIEEAVDKYDDHCVVREFIEDIIGCADLSKWEWPE
jgi:hypothetical protein